MKRTVLILLVLSGWTCLTSTVPSKERNLLSSKYDREFLQRHLSGNTDWVAFPSYTDRKAWERIPIEVRTEYLREGEKALDTQWPSVPATSYLEFERSGNRRLQEEFLSKITAPLRSLFMAELIEAKGRYTDQLMNGVWALCETTFWGSTAHLSLQQKGRGLPNVKEPPIDLGASATGHFLAWVHYFFHQEFDKINPLISERIEFEIHRRILEPFYTRNDFWWMGFRDRTVNNWNPYCNGHVLATVMLMEKDVPKRLDAVHKVMVSLDKFTNGYGDDGGCNEGPGYWGMAGASHFECLLLLKTITHGKIDIFDHPLIRNMGRYIYMVDIRYPYFLNFADASARTSPNAYLVYRYGECIADPWMQRFGAFLARKQDFGKTRLLGSPFIQLEGLWNMDKILDAEAQEPLLGEFWFPDLQVAGARDRQGETQGFFWGAKGGHNAESHNHNDIGSFVLYYDGEPVIVDAGVGTYTAQTFSPKRYEIWTMQSAFHNLPSINGRMQAPGKEFRAEKVAFRSSPTEVTFSLDIAPAYPADASVRNWQRTYTFNRGKGLDILDAYELKAVKGPTSLSFLTLPVPNPAESGRIDLSLPSGKTIRLEFSPHLWKAVIEKIPMTDSRLRQIWGENLYRIQLTSVSNPLQSSSTVNIRL